jgi:ABC-type uncharacterized transport system substrate-binding protein
MKLSELFSRCFLATLFLISICFGHAHIFIDYKLHACVSDNGLDGVFVNWTFDRMYTEFLQEEYDKNKDGKFDKSEQKNVFLNSFKECKSTHYFAVVEVDGNNYSIPEPTDFSTRILKDEGCISYTFYLPLKIKAEKKQKSIKIYFFDPIIYVSFTVMKDDISIVNKSKNIEADISLKQVEYANHATIVIKQRS